MKPNSGSAFGASSRPSLAHGFGTPFGDSPDLWERLSQIQRERFQQLPWLLAAAVTLVPASVSEPERIVLTQAFNDTQILIDQALGCDGRSAARTARSLFEHLVNWHTVSTEPDAAARFHAGLLVTQAKLVDLEPGVGLMPKNRARSERVRLSHVRRRNRRALSRAIAEHRLRRAYGSLRSGFSHTVKVRAEAAGLLEHYERYSVLSAVVHGDAGGMLGLHKKVMGEIVHRVGNDVELARLSHLWGVEWLSALYDSVATSHTAPAVRELAAYCDTLLKEWPDLEGLLRELDAELWPGHAPPRPTAIAALYGGPGSVKILRWFLYVPSFQGVIRADPPDGIRLSPEIYSALETKANSDRRRPDRPVRVALNNVTVTPREGSPWHPASLVLTPKA